MNLPLMKLTTLITYALVFLSSRAGAQCRPASLQQNAAYEKIVTELQNQFKKNLPAGNWRVFDERHSLGKLEVSDEYGRLFHACGDRYDLTLQRSDIAQQQQTRTDNSSKAIGDTNTRQEHSLVLSTDSVYREADATRSNELIESTVDINVEMNAGNYRLQEPISNRFVSSYKLIHVKGAPLALQITLAPDQSGITPRPETVVLLGNWKNNLQADSKGNKLYHYSYSKGGSLIENLVVTIKAPANIVTEILQKVNWQELSHTLTK